MGKYLALTSSFQWKKRSLKAMRRERGRKRRRGDDPVAPEIPFELMIEILIRLPAKSLMKFKCVSKLWSSLISSRYFSNRYLMVASPPRPHRLYVSLVGHVKCTGSMKCRPKPGESVLLSLSSSSSSTRGELFDQDLTMPNMGGRNMVELRGLVLYIRCSRACIYNPATRQSVTLKAVRSNIGSRKEYHNYVLYFFGHDPVLDQYKVVCTLMAFDSFNNITSEHWVLLLEAGGGSWKKIECEQPHVPSTTGLCIDGVIYYLASTSMSTGIVVSFDVRSEEFNLIQGPEDVLDVYRDYVDCIEYGGRPAIFDRSRQMGLVDLWVLEDGGTWSRKSLVLQPCQMHLVDNVIPLVVLGTTRKGEVVLVPCKSISPFYILYYDLQKNDIRKVIVRGIPDRWLGKPHRDFYFYFLLMDNKESIMHLES